MGFAILAATLTLRSPFDATMTSPHTSSQHIIYEIFGPPEIRPFSIRYWDGFEERGNLETPLFTIVLRSPASLRKMFFPPSEVRIARAYIKGDFDIEGQVEEATALSPELLTTFGSLPKLLRIMFMISRLPRNDYVRTRPVERGERAFRPTTSS